MATFIWLNEAIRADQSRKCLVNLDNVRHVSRNAGETATFIYFARGEEDKHFITVRETPEEVHTLWLQTTKSIG